MSYGWPVKPFDEQHAVRGFFCDPRIGAKGSKALHFGIDVCAPDGTPVYAVAGGTVHSEGAQNVGVVTGSGRSHGYWHIVKHVRHGQRVRKHQLLGHVARTWGHVHFAERIDGHYWNPLREGALTPFHDFGAPVIDRIVAERGSRILEPGALIGVVNLIAVAHDNPPISAPPPWRGMPVTPALVAGGSCVTGAPCSRGVWRSTSAPRSEANSSSPRSTPPGRVRTSHRRAAATASGSCAAGTCVATATAATASTSRRPTFAATPRAGISSSCC